MSSLDIAPHPEGAPARVRDRRRMRRRFRVSFRRAGICTIWRLGFRQFSFHHIARVPRRTVPDTWTRPPVSCHALVPLTFRRQVRHQTQGNPSNPSRLSRGYDEAPRGAPLSCRDEVSRVTVSGMRAPLEGANVRAARQGMVDARGVGPSGRYRLRCVVESPWQPARVAADLGGSRDEPPGT
jgi:hypothetical protein